MLCVGARSYATYYAYLLDCIRPRAAPLALTRVIMSAFPDMSGGDGGSGGARPVLQVFKAGVLLYSSDWAVGADGGVEQGPEAA